ncbi:MAG: LCP family protein [Rhodococcus sp.]|nr:LCP family protein [Rhodococcus sp. (in: high G+C Gram-positive bacteria)]
MLVLVVTGFAWRSIDSLRDAIATASGLGLGGGADGAVDILLVGTDSRTDAHGNPLSEEEIAALRAGNEVVSNTDTLVLVRIPNDGSSATAISIPRDAYVAVPGLGKSKINGAYGITKENERQKLLDRGTSEEEAERLSTEKGRQTLIRTVADLTGVTIDHYAEIGLLGFVLLTDAVDGVEVCLNEPVYEPLSGADFSAGTQTLHGSDALSFVRQRHNLPRGDLDRIVRQQVFMASLAGKILSARTLSDPGKLGQLTKAIERSVVLDEDWDIIDFATRLQDITGGQVKFETIPVRDLDGVSSYGESIVTVDPSAVQKFVDGLAGDDNDTPDTSSAPDIDRSSVTVDVANAGGTAGLASGVSSGLTALGFPSGQVGNYNGTRAVDETTVFAPSSDDDAADAVAELLGGVATAVDSSLPEGTVRIVLTEDYTGPSSASEFGADTDSSYGTGGSSTGQSSTSEAPAQGSDLTGVPGPTITAGGNGPRCVN